MDPKVLGSVALRGVAGSSEKSGCWGVYATCGMGEAQSKKNLFYARISVVCLKSLFMRGYSLCLGGAGAMRPDGMRRWEGGTSSI